MYLLFGRPFRSSSFAQKINNRGNPSVVITGTSDWCHHIHHRKLNNPCLFHLLGKTPSGREAIYRQLSGKFPSAVPATGSNRAKNKWVQQDEVGIHVLVRPTSWVYPIRFDSI